MSTTLTNGLKLPDKGSVDWYADMQSNYAILDGAVGTVAEHTTQIAGKAPAVHTHTKSDITDFPAYGNAAGTICEGNDSRLSDARTPVAHTHTKSDVTDLLNSNFIPSANNSYDLGSSSYQWNNLYSSKIRQIDSFSSYADVYQVLDSSSNRIVSFRITKGTNKNTLGINVHDQNNSAPKGLVIENDLSNNITITGGGVNNYLGTSTNKWKSLNGVNPGALSLPSGNYDPIDTNSWDLTGATGQSYTPTVNGWLFISVQNVAGNYLSIVSGRGAISIDGTGAQNGLRAMLPVIANESVTITVKTGAIFAARFYPMQGNVS